MNTAALYRQQRERVQEVAPFLPVPESFVPVGPWMLQSLRSLDSVERRLLKEHGWAYSRNGRVWIKKPDKCDATNFGD